MNSKELGEYGKGVKKTSLNSTGLKPEMLDSLHLLGLGKAWIMVLTIIRYAAGFEDRTTLFSLKIFKKFPITSIKYTCLCSHISFHKLSYYYDNDIQEDGLWTLLWNSMPE